MNTGHVTLRSTLNRYANAVARGLADADLSRDERQLTARLLRAVAAPSIVTDREALALDRPYPWTDDDRAALRSCLHHCLLRTYATPALYHLTLAGWDRAVSRAQEIISNV